MATSTNMRLNAADTLNLLAILVLGMALGFLRQPLGDLAPWLTGFLAILLMCILLSAQLAHRHPWWRVVHDFSPILVIPVIFNTLGPIIETARPDRWDGVFAAADTQLFGVLPDLWRGALGRPAWLTDLASVGYCMYYPLFLILGVSVYLRRPATDFGYVAFTIVLCFYLSYVGYVVFPTLGPRPAPAVIGGSTVTRAVLTFIDAAERNRTDAFPSGHTALPLICVYFAWTLSRRLFVPLCVLSAVIIFSTVYLHFHYVVDVAAGIALAAACIWLGPRLQPFFEPQARMRRLTLHSNVG